MPAAVHLKLPLSGTGNWRQLARNLVHVAPRPPLAGHDRTHDWMLGFVEMLCSVFPCRGVAATHMAACHALSQSDPLSSFLEAFLACAGRVRWREISLRQILQVVAWVCHNSLGSSWDYFSNRK